MTEQQPTTRPGTSGGDGPAESTLEFNGKRYLDGRASDPLKFGWMRGAPPASKRRISYEGGYEFPQIRWTLSHVRELVPTINVWRGSEGPSHFERSDRASEIENLSFADSNGKTRRFEDALYDTYTDGLAVVHRGRLIYERYFGELWPHLPHALHSVTKSFAGTIAASLVHERVLDDSKLIPHYVPELRGTAWGDATLRQVMDMQTGLAYSEDYADENSGVNACGRAAAHVRPKGYKGPHTLCEYLETVRKEGEHGVGFSYKSINTEVMTWVMERATGRTFAELLQERLWGAMGCEEDASVGVDSAGKQRAGGGMSVTLRDLARFGELVRQDGSFRGRQLVPAPVVDDILTGGNPAKVNIATLPGYAYRSMWWVTNNELRAFEARGVHGQLLYVAPEADLVVARFSSHPIASSAAHNDVTIPQMLALGRMLR